MEYCSHVSKSLTDTQRNEHLHKIELQEVFAHRLSKFFRSISVASEDLYSSTGQVLDVEEFRPELIKLFKQHYLLVSGRFLKSKSILKKSILKQSQEIIDSQVLDQISAQIDLRSANQTDLVLNTTQKNLNNSYHTTEATQDSPSLYEISAIATTEFELDSETQIERITITETQNAAESTKFIEAAVTAGIVFYDPETGGASVSENSIHTWNSILIETTRDIHSEADGQIVPINEPFIVGGEKLRFPGDDSLGASAHNLINCLCSAEYIIS